MKPKPSLRVLSSLALAGVALSCLDRPVETLNPKTTNVFVESLRQDAVDKIDLLFMIDNSISMADKQQILASAVPDLVRRLVSPVCLDHGAQVSWPNAADEPCPVGAREFPPVKDIHIGIVTSSLGAHGADNGAEGNCQTTEEELDMGVLLGSRPRAARVPTTDGFLTFPGAAPDAFGNLIQLAGEHGCGFEASLEAWYRFLVDPAPPQDVVLDGPNAKRNGSNRAILDQRAAFLRPDSLVAVIMVTDENDCSIRDGGQFYFAADTKIRLPEGSPACADDPNDRCCFNCKASVPSGCAACPPSPDAEDADPLNLRCWNQKERFGIDFLYPTARYVNALRKKNLCMDRADLADDGHCNDVRPNPLFDGKGGPARPENLVFFATIVGVPWQLIQARKDAHGKDVPEGELRYMTSKELADSGAWDAILGGDPHMVESVLPRSGPGMQPPGSSSATADPMNGHEWAVNAKDDLQYACIFPLEDPKNCVDAAGKRKGCDCSDPEGAAADKVPLCQAPDGSYGSMQYRAKAYPGLRHLQVAKDFGANSIVASICARNVTNDDAKDYGYRPAIAAIIDRLKEGLGGKCLGRQVLARRDGTIPCSVVEAFPASGVCPPCKDATGRFDPDEAVAAAVRGKLPDLALCGGADRPSCDAFCLCGIQSVQQAKPPEIKGDCTTEEGSTDTGWCYVDPFGTPRIGNEALVSSCDAVDRRVLRFVGENTPRKKATAFIACLGAELED